MRVSEIPEISRLSIPEKILLVEDLWDNIATDDSAISVPLSHTKELEKRLKSHKAAPGALLSLEDLQARIDKRK